MIVSLHIYELQQDTEFPNVSLPVVHPMEHPLIIAPLRAVLDLK